MVNRHILGIKTVQTTSLVDQSLAQKVTITLSNPAILLPVSRFNEMINFLPLAAAPLCCESKVLTLVQFIARSFFLSIALLGNLTRLAEILSYMFCLQSANVCKWNQGCLLQM